MISVTHFKSALSPLNHFAIIARISCSLFVCTSSTMLGVLQRANMDLIPTVWSPNPDWSSFNEPSVATSPIYFFPQGRSIYFWWRWMKVRSHFWLMCLLSVCSQAAEEPLNRRDTTLLLLSLGDPELLALPDSRHARLKVAPPHRTMPVFWALIGT